MPYKRATNTPEMFVSDQNLQCLKLIVSTSCTDLLPEHSL